MTVLAVDAMVIGLGYCPEYWSTTDSVEDRVVELNKVCECLVYWSTTDSVVDRVVGECAGVSTPGS
jgi:hypothetical protein